ncbi:MAG: hypothetical protein RSA24_00750 [Clostridia bacterium]
MQLFCGSTLIDDYFNTDGKYKKVSKKSQQKSLSKKTESLQKKDWSLFNTVTSPFKFAFAFSAVAYLLFMQQDSPKQLLHCNLNSNQRPNLLVAILLHSLLWQVQ